MKTEGGKATTWNEQIKTGGGGGRERRIKTERVREREREQMKTERGKRDSVNRSKLGGPRERERENV